MSTENPLPRWLVRFGYDGSGFAGWARQPGLRTVEGVIRSGITRLGLADTPETARLEVASRTDRGVSARANALALSSDARPDRILRSLNGLAPDIFFHRIRPVAPDFRPRKARSRTYRYYELARGRSLSTWRKGAQLFEGRIDARSLGRKISPEAPQFRVIQRMTVTRSPPFLVVEVRAPSFVWGMVRKMIGALRSLDEGQLQRAELRQSLEGAHRIFLPMAEADGLILWEVRYSEPWGRLRGQPSKAQRAHFDAQYDRSLVRGRVLSQLTGGSRLF